MGLSALLSVGQLARIMAASLKADFFDFDRLLRGFTEGYFFVASASSNFMRSDVTLDPEDLLQEDEVGTSFLSQSTDDDDVDMLVLLVLGSQSCDEEYKGNALLDDLLPMVPVLVPTLLLRLD